MSTSAHQVLRALSNRVYAGELTFRGITATGCHDPFVEESVFDEAERILASRSQSPVRLISVATRRPTPRGRPRPPPAGQPACGGSTTKLADLR